MNHFNLLVFFEKLKLRKNIYFLVVCCLIFLKNFIIGPRVSTDYELRYLPMGIGINKLLHGDSSNILNFSTFDNLHLGYSIVVVFLMQISAEHLPILIITLQTLLSFIAFSAILNYFDDIRKFILFSILYFLFYELNQWDYWLTPDSIFRSIIIIIYIKYIFDEKFDINNYLLVLCILILTLFRMEAVIYFLIFIYYKYGKLSVFSKKLYILLVLLLSIPTSYGIIQMMIDTYNLGLITGGTEGPKEFINFLEKERFGDSLIYFLILYGMRFMSVILPLSPSWSYIHLLYNLSIYIIIVYFYVNYIKINGNILIKKWLFTLYILLVVMQVCFLVDPTLRYMYTVYILILIYLIKNSKIDEVNLKYLNL